MSGNWLPGLMLFNDHGNDWKRYLEAIYLGFQEDFVHSRPTVRGLRCGLKRYPLSQDKEATFWHFVSEGDVEADRTIDFRRCERIRWPRAMIDSLGTDRVLDWLNERKSGQMLNIALPDFSYLVVMSMRDGFVLPWTAFEVVHPHQRRKRAADYERSLRNG